MTTNSTNEMTPAGLCVAGGVSSAGRRHVLNYVDPSLHASVRTGGDAAVFRAALVAAVADAAASVSVGQAGGVVELGSGYFSLGAAAIAVDIPDGVTVVGYGGGSQETLNQGSTVLAYTGTGIAVRLSGNKTALRGVDISCSESAATGLYVGDGASTLHVEATDVSVSGATLTPIVIANSIFVDFYRVNASGVAGGAATGVTVDTCNEVHFYSCLFRLHATGKGAVVDESDMITFVDTDLEGTAVGIAVGTTVAAQVIVDHSRFEGCGIGIHVVRNGCQVISRACNWGAATIGIKDDSTDHLSDFDEPHISYAITPVSGSTISAHHLKAPATVSSGAMPYVGADGWTTLNGPTYTAVDANFGGPSVKFAANKYICGYDGNNLYFGWLNAGFTYVRGAALVFYGGATQAAYIDANQWQLNVATTAYHRFALVGAAVGTTTLAAGDNNDVNPGGTNTTGKVRVRFTCNAAGSTITGLVNAGVDGQIFIIENDPTGTLTIANDRTSTASYRFLTGQAAGADLVVPPNATRMLIYDTTDSRFRVIG